MSHALWLGILCGLAIALVFALRPVLAWAAARIHHWRTHRHDHERDHQPR